MLPVRYTKLTRRHQASQSADSYFSGSFITLSNSALANIEEFSMLKTF